MPVDLYIDEEGQLHFYKRGSTPTKPMQRIGIAHLSLEMQEGPALELLPPIAINRIEKSNGD